MRTLKKKKKKACRTRVLPILFLYHLIDKDAGPESVWWTHGHWAGGRMGTGTQTSSRQPGVPYSGHGAYFCPRMNELLGSWTFGILMNPGTKKALTIQSRGLGVQRGRGTWLPAEPGCRVVSQGGDASQPGSGPPVNALTWDSALPHRCSWILDSWSSRISGMVSALFRMA